jgi:hypothetical protein
MAVAQHWTVSVGCQAEQETDLPATHIARHRRKRAATQPPARRLSGVVRGRLKREAMLFNAEVFPCGELLAEAWPQTITPPRKRPRPSQLRQRERKRQEKGRARAAAGQRQMERGGSPRGATGEGQRSRQ